MVAAVSGETSSAGRPGKLCRNVMQEIAMVRPGGDPARGRHLDGPGARTIREPI